MTHARRVRPADSDRSRPNWIAIREPGTDWLLFKYDPARKLIEIQRRGRKTVVDLAAVDVTRG